MQKLLLPCVTLLVTAHPDDEVLFFSPLLSQFMVKEKRGCDKELHILCLSTGNAEGLGEVRVGELYAAAALFGLDRAHVTVVDHPSLQDGMNTQWPVEVVADMVLQQARRLSAQLVVTFDAQGASGHLNHIATHHGVRGDVVEVTRG
ncbi:hypothetical protein EON65_59060, partial [archaeon]